MAKEPEKVSFRDRLRQFGTAFTFARRHDKLLVLWLIGAFLVPLAAAVALSVVTGLWLFIMPAGFLFAVLATMIVFNRRISKATFAEIDGKPGAAAALLQNMRGNWRVTPAAAFTPQQDMAHRIIGRPGIILVVEGSVTRLKNAIAQEKKRIQRIAPDTPIYDVVIGDGEGEVPLRKLQSHLVKLPRNITPRQVNALEERLRALAGTKPPIPKGPLPKGARMPKGSTKMQRR